MFKKLSIALAALAAVCTIGLGLFASAPNAFANTTVYPWHTNVSSGDLLYDAGNGFESSTVSLSVYDQFLGSSYQGAWAFNDQGNFAIGFNHTNYLWADSSGTSSYWYGGATGTDGTTDFKFGIACNSAHPHTGSLSLYSYAWGKYATFQNVGGEEVVEFNSSTPSYNMSAIDLCS